jgi:putative DNA primase/helicase
MAAANYDDVLDQLRSSGLIDERLEVGTPRPVRCKVEGDREKRGWYSLHELQAPGGDLLIVGSYGVWRGNDNTAQKIELRKREISQEQRDVLRKRLAEDKRRADALRQREAARAAETAAKAWAALHEDGDADYLAAKHVAAYGLRFTKNASAVLPLLDTAGRIHGLQFLRTAAQAKEARRPAKEFWPAGLIKKGHFHLIGSPSWVVLVAEGYATAASLHMATGHPVAVAFDAGNLRPVAEALRKRYPRTKILICADDDAFSEGNPGITSASAAAMAVQGAWIAPQFADEDARRSLAEKGTKRTDFNDLQAAEGLHVVRVQVEAKLSALRWAHQAAGAAATSDTGGAGNDKLKAIQSLEHLLERYALVYAHGGAVFDRREHLLMSLSDMRDACIRRDIHRAWAEHPDRAIVRIREVGFDPTGRDPVITCNLFGGWPTQPKAGSCEKLLDLLRYMCSGDRNADHLYRWVLRWIAYPIQHPGAKMKSTVVVHGPQGTGKNLFFEAVMKIYGEYGDVLDQSAVEDKFNDWASRKLFMIADEVVARSDLYHIKNKLKGLITGDRILINPKGFKSHWERNHLNLAFLSNEAMPVVLEEDDRRHCVIWTPEKAAPDFYQAVLAELRDGGAAALHDYLLHLDLGDFSPGTLPPLTAAKADLINLGLDSPLRFHDELIAGEIPGLDAMPGLTLDWFEIYRIWCGRANHRAAPQNKFSNLLNRKRDVLNAKKHYRPATLQKGPHAFLFIGGYAPPDGGVEMDWLGQSSAKVKAMLDDYRGGAK